MLLLDCTQDFIYEHGDDVYPTTGKVARPWPNKLPPSLVPKRLTMQQREHVCFVDCMSYAALQVISVHVLCQARNAAEPENQRHRDCLHACLVLSYNSCKVTYSLHTSGSLTLPWLQMHLPSIVQWTLVSEVNCSQTMNFKTCQTTAPGTLMPKQMRPCRRCSEGCPSLPSGELVTPAESFVCYTLHAWPVPCCVLLY